ncbi:hypothetical protein ACHAQD_002022 [Fusarium lateritium]
MATIANADATTTPSGALVALVMREHWQYNDQAEYVLTDLRGKVPAGLETNDLLRLFPKDEELLVQASDSEDWGWPIFVCNRRSIYGK